MTSDMTKRTTYLQQNLRVEILTQNRLTFNRLFYAMPISLSRIVSQFTQALKEVDSEEPTEDHERYKPGIGPFKEPKAIDRALEKLQAFEVWHDAETEVEYPSSGKNCDLLIPGKWAIEVKLVRPFRDNGDKSPHWVENALYPYEGNESAIGDCMKLRESNFSEQKAVVMYGFEHTPPKIPLETTMEAFEAITEEVHGINLGPRRSAGEKGLVHPVHEQVKTYGWVIPS